MNGNDMTFEAYLYENRVSPTPEFSARIDMVCEQIRRREAKPDEARPANGRRGGRSRKFRWLAPVAAVLLLFMLLFCIPGVSQAVRGWLNDMFRLSDYMAAEPGDREENADIEKAVQTPAPTGSTASVRYLDETEYYEGVDEWRAENGFSAFSRDDYAWVAGIDPEAGEILYDGRNLIVNTVLHANPSRFLGLYGGEGERFDIWTSSVSVTVGGEAYTDFDDQGGGLALQPFMSDAGGYDMDAVNAADSVIEQTTLIGSQSPAFPSGPVTVTIEMWLMDGTIDDLGTVGLVAIITQTLTFDATDGNGMLGSVYSVTQRLSGIAPLTISGSGSIENKMFDYSTVSVTATVEKRTTGINVTLHYAFSTQEEEEAYWDDVVPGATGRHGVQYEAIIDGESIGKVWHNSDYLGLKDDPVLEIPLTESELSAVRSITLRPWVRYVSAYSVNGSNDQDMPFDEKLYFDRFSSRYSEVPLEGCDIVIPLDGT